MNRRTALVFSCALLQSACGDSDRVPHVGPETVLFTTTPPPTPVATAPPAGVRICALGKGTLDSTCARSSSAHQRDVESAIDAVVRTQPGLFALAESPSDGVYRVVNVSGYFAAVVETLRSAGFCAESDGVQSVQVKKSNDVSERHAILTSDAFIRRGDSAYRESCRPAMFPVDDVDYIDAVRVHFYGIQCPDGITAPDNAEKKLPIGCTGFVSATPKDRDNKDVPARIHGPDIEWDMFPGDGHPNPVSVADFPGQPFNKLVDAHEEGFFTMCAKVKEVKGCFGFHTFR